MAEETISAAELLARVPLLSGLEARELERIAQVAIPRSFPKGARVFHEGDESDACYVIREGEVRVTREHSDGRAIALATLGPGELVGELAMLDGGVRSASVEALTDVELLARLGRRHARPARAQRRDHGEARRRADPAPARDERADQPPVLPDGAEPGRRRALPARQRGRRRAGPRRGDDPDEPGDLAQLAGTSRESVSRFLAVLERAGVVRVGRGRVTVLEPPRLRAYIF